METRKPPKSKLPYLVAIAGILLSFDSWVFLDDYLPNFYEQITHRYPWSYLIFTIIISILIGILIGFIESLTEKNQKFAEINEELQHEIHERMSLEESRQKLEIALLQGQKLQAIGTLAGGIAHDFNNILYAIIGYVELSLADLPKGDQSTENLKKVLAGAKRGQDLVSRILSFSRRQHHDLVPLNVNQVIESVLSLLKPTVPASVEIVYQSGFDGEIKANQTQLHQVLVNLINNAVDAMDGEGKITIKTERIPQGDKLLMKFPEMLEKNYCRIDVTDTGSGMDPATMKRIFEPFYTTKEVGKGTGLGLSIVHSIIKDHQGEITVSSKLGEGTTFSILLPEHLSP